MNVNEGRAEMLLYVLSLLLYTVLYNVVYGNISYLGREDFNIYIYAETLTLHCLLS